MNRHSTQRAKPTFSGASLRLAVVAVMACTAAACGQKADPFQSCVATKTAEVKQTEEGKRMEENALIASAKKACLAAMPSVKEPTITGY